MKYFSSYDDLPQCTSLGYSVVKCPEKVWNLIADVYCETKHLIKEERFDGKEFFLPGTGQVSELIDISVFSDVVSFLHRNTQDIHEEFCGMSLRPTNVYGIRSYNTGASLKPHRDRFVTHHIGSIIIVDKDLKGGRDWPFNLQDHSGKWHDVYAERGDMILFESARCMHGRCEAFEGNWYRNLFINFNLKEWKATDVQ